MEPPERRRRRKSPSFKIISDREYGCQSDSVELTNTAEEPPNASGNEAWLAEEGVEIKKQITGMMRLLNDKAGRVYQRVSREGDALKEEPQEEHLSWASTQSQEPEEPEQSWNPGSHSQYDTRSKTQKTIDPRSRDPALPRVLIGTTAESSCCMCNCKSTLQAILLELRTMRKLMQTQQASGSSDKHNITPSNMSRRRSCKRRAVHKVTVMTPPTKTVQHLHPPIVARSHEMDCGDREVKDKQGDRTVSAPLSTTSLNPTPSHYSLKRATNCTEPEVQLAEDYEVFIPKAQLDSILLNYTRSGSLLFRKLVCAFFDDATLANSLPNGKRKRGLNDHRKGLDQNIVGAIKVFTEKYCTENRIEKLPGPRDWVQILQDQIKLARRRLKRAVAETNTECEVIIRSCPEETGSEAHRQL